MIRICVSAVLIVALSAPIAATPPRTPRQRALNAATRSMLARGWHPTGRTVRRQLAAPDVKLRRTSSGTQIDDEGIVISFEGWDDGQSTTWEGLVTITGQISDEVVHIQQVDFADPDNPQLVLDDQIWAQGAAGPDEDVCPDCGNSPPPDIQAGGTPGPHVVLVGQRTDHCPECPVTGTAVKRVRLDPDFRTFYKCSGAGCGVSGLVSILGLVFVPEYAFASMFWNGCTSSLLACSWNLWRWTKK